MRRETSAWVTLLVLAVSMESAPAQETESLRSLVLAQGVSGREEPVRKAIRNRLPPGALPEVDNQGNLTLILGAGSPSRLLIAPLDEPGYVVSRIQEDGYLRVQRLTRVPLSPLYDQFLVGQPVLIGTDSPERFVPGVSAVLSTHLQRGRRPDPAGTVPPSPEDLVIDVGARSAAEAEAAGVRLLAPVTLEKELTVLAGSRVAGPSLEGRLGCEILLELASRLDPARLKGQVILAWAAQSWVGFRGAERLARRFAPDEVVIIDSYAPDPPNFPSRVPEGIPGRGPLLARSEEGSGLSAILEERLRESARRSSVPIQRVDLGTLHDGRPFTLRRVGVVGVPVRFPGTPAEMADLADLRRLVAWMQAHLEERP